MAEKATMTQLSQALNSQGRNFVTVDVSPGECYASVLYTKTTAILWETIIVFIVGFCFICLKSWQDHLDFLLQNQRGVAFISLVVLRHIIGGLREMREATLEVRWCLWEEVSIHKTSPGALNLTQSSSTACHKNLLSCSTVLWNQGWKRRKSSLHIIKSYVHCSGKNAGVCKYHLYSSKEGLLTE